mgnify:CR=1 FL=1
MRDLNYQLKELCRRNRDGSYATQQNRERQLSLMADQLHALGYRAMNARSLKPKHVEALLRRWQGEGLSIGTIKNRMAALRWLVEDYGYEITALDVERAYLHTMKAAENAGAADRTRRKLAKKSGPRRLRPGDRSTGAGTRGDRLQRRAQPVLG